jgi:SAM-dependent methyltransferase
MEAGIQQAEQKWHDDLYATRREQDLVVPLSIRNRYLSPPRTSRFYLECLFNLVGDVANKRVLVFGCGDDNTTVLLALKGAEVWAFDISEEAIRLQEKMALANDVQDRIHLFVCAAEEFPFAPNSFDLIVGTAILHHIPDHLSRLPQQLAPVLDRNGRALFVEPVILSPALGRLMAWLPGHQDISPGERQLTDGDIGHFGKCFRVTPHYFCFLARLDRFILNMPLEDAPAWQRLIVNVIHRFDSIILSVSFLNRLAGVAVLELSSLQQ